MSADMDNEVHIMFRETLTEMKVVTDPELYWSFVLYKTGKPVLYIRIQKALYGCLISAMLFYEKLVGNLKLYGFMINPYDMCMTKKMIGGKQLTVCWHMENLKISCVDANEVTKMIQWLESESEEMYGSRGKRND